MNLGHGNDSFLTRLGSICMFRGLFSSSLPVSNSRDLAQFFFFVVSVTAPFFFIVRFFFFVEAVVAVGVVVAGGEGGAVWCVWGFACGFV